VAWLAIWIGWVALFDWGSRLLGDLPPEVSDAPPVVVAILVFGMVVLAPAMEELLFRGLLFRLFERSRLGANGAVAITAVLFAAMHVQYWDRWLGLSQVFLDGILLGLARKTARSVPLCFLMHAIGNGYAAYLRFHG
jgi:membrane protease YdiL (CAAX protease family)